MNEIQDIRGLLVGIKDADRVAQIEKLLKTVERKFIAANSVDGAIKKKKRVTEPTYLKNNTGGVINMSGMSGKERAAMRAFFQ